MLLAIVSLAAPALAHEEESGAEGPHNWHELSHAWGTEPGSWLGLIVLACLYVVGTIRLWCGAGVGHGVRIWESMCFIAAWLTLFVALVSPLHPWGSMLFSAHMAQHELLMLVAAPLLVLARPMPPMLYAMPTTIAHRLGWLSNRRWWSSAWRIISLPMVAWLIHALVLWAWHAPELFQATQHSEWIHAAQHTSFLVAAVLFWWSLVHARRGPAAYGAAILYLFTTALHSGLLGALLTFARTTWYPVYEGRTQAWGLTTVQDQALGGLIMWVPACTIYILAALALFASWLRESDRQPRSRQFTCKPGPQHAPAENAR